MKCRTAITLRLVRRRLLAHRSLNGRGVSGVCAHAPLPSEHAFRAKGSKCGCVRTFVGLRGAASFGFSTRTGLGTYLH